MVSAFAQAQDAPSEERQPATPSMTDEEAAKAVAGCAACGTGMIFILVTALVLNIVILVWVARDAKARGMDNVVMWIILIVFTHFIGLIVYLFARTQGNLVPCPHCSNKRLAASAKCPHCGNA
ncbi:MAG: hypothetical protein QOE70_6862 [Chthoniobacter sp.]|nr:hypothetical protein [Chthoniobacter sp.]